MSLSVTECRKCKDFYGECQGKPGYEPREIRFCPWQFIWLIENIAALHEFDWPGGAKADIPRRKRPGGGGYFETPVDYAYEVERRLEHCGFDGLMVYLRYAYDWDELQLSKYYRISVAEVKQRIEALLWHISGWNFYIDRPYRRWHVYRNYEYWKKSQEKQ